MSNDLAGNTPTVNEQMMRHIEAQIQQSASAHVHAVQNRNIVFPGKPTDIPYNLDLYAHLETTQALIPNFSTEEQLNETRLSKLPLIGRVITSIQTQLHQVARFYTNRALGHQRAVNEQICECLEQLTIESQKQQRTISQLQMQLDALQKESAQ